MSDIFLEFLIKSFENKVISQCFKNQNQDNKTPHSYKKLKNKHAPTPKSQISTSITTDFF